MTELGVHIYVPFIAGRSESLRAASGRAPLFVDRECVSTFWIQYYGFPSLLWFPLSQ